MIRTLVLWGMGMCWLGVGSAAACPMACPGAAVRSIATLDDDGRLAPRLRPAPSLLAATRDDAAFMELRSFDEPPTAAAMRRWLASLAVGLVVLFVLMAASLGLFRLAHLRRPLALALAARRGLPSVVALSLLSPLLPPLLLVHADRVFWPSPVFMMASAGAVAALTLWAARRRLLNAVDGCGPTALAGLAGDGTVLTSGTALRLVPPPGARGRVPWYLADLILVDGQGRAQVALAEVDVDDQAALLLTDLAHGRATEPLVLTVFGCGRRIPADAAAADPLCRNSPTMPRLGRFDRGRGLITSRSPADLAWRLRLECLGIGLLFSLLTGAALVSLLH